MQDLNKKAVWVSESADTYVIKYVDKENENEITCTDGSNYKTVDICKVNPEKFATVSDLSQLTYLNEPSILHCLKNRLEIQNIYTNSGMFLISMNPYKQIAGLYDKDTKRKVETKRYADPHIFKTVSDAYTSMIETGVNQSILITGESGAGKTENTKKVIEYLSYISGDGLNNINKLLIKANPLVEAFGNAKTVKNENSSRFGKFIQVYFVNRMIVGGKIDTYLLEMSRITSLKADERNYHIFYYLLKSGDDEMLKELQLNNKTYKDFNLLKDGSEVAHGIDDTAEYKIVVECFKLFGIDHMEYFKQIAAILHLSNLQFEMKGDNVIIKNVDLLETIASLLDKEVKQIYDALVNPVVTAGRETIKKSTTVETCLKLVEAIIKNLYNKLFMLLVESINKVFFCSNSDAFIGVLDIAGFEIFKNNSFEQLLINYTNEKLQQFFNTKMFEEEQKVYQNECIPWDYIDFGLGLEPCIKAIEGYNPIGILSYLDEECVMPGATDISVLRKIKTINLSNSNGYVVRDVKMRPDAFALQHYAGVVDYTVDDWIQKNKHISSDVIDEMIGAVSFSKKKGIFRTVAQEHKEQLKQLMRMLSQTRPYFVRCILPNLKKRFGEINNKLVLDQLRCNGILEGLRIARLGYPTRVTFAEFCNRYNFMMSESSINAKKYDFSLKIIEHLKKVNFITENDFKIGKTMIFFKHGVIGDLENYRIEFLVKMASAAQNAIRRQIATRKENYEKIMKDSVDQLKKDIQAHRAYVKCKWFALYRKVKPLIAVRNKEEEEAEIQKRIDQYKDVATKAQEEIEYLKQTVETLQSKIVEITRDNEKKIADFEDNVSTLEEINQGLRTMINDKDKCLMKVEENSKLVEVEFNKLKSAEEDNARKVIEASNETKEIKIKLESKIKEIDELQNKQTAELKTNQLNLENKQVEVDTLQTEIKTLKGDKAELTVKCEDLDKDINHLKEKNQQLDKEYKKIQEEMTRKKEEDLKNNSELQTLTEKVEKLESTLKKVKIEKEELSKENLKIAEEKMEDMFKAESNLTQLKNKMQLDINKLMTKNKELEEELESKAGDVVNAAILLETKQEHMKQLNEMEVKNFDLSQKLTEFKVSCENLSARKDDLESDYAELKERVALLEKEKQEVMMKPYDLLTKEKEEHLAMVEQLRKNYEDLFDKYVFNKKDEASELKIAQLERLINDQQCTIELLSKKRRKNRLEASESSNK